MKIKTTFSQLYNFQGFRAKSRFKSGVKGDSNARVVELTRHQKKRFVPYVEQYLGVFTTTGYTGFGTYLAVECESTLNSSIGEFIVQGAVQ